MVREQMPVSLQRCDSIPAVLKQWLFIAALTMLLMSHAVAGERTVLRVCADPNSLPFSNKAQQGFENRLADLIAGELDLPVEYTWFPQRRGFSRHTLRAKDPATGDYKCDLIMGVPAGFELGIATDPYYRSTYVLVYAKGRGLDQVKTPEDFVNLEPSIRSGLRVGVHDATPGAGWLAKHGMFEQMMGFPVMDADPDVYPGLLVEKDLASGDLDAVVIWGPIGGYFAKQAEADGVPMEVIPLASADGLRFDFAIASAVRFGEGDWKNQIEEIYAARSDEIEALLDEYGVPRVAASSPPLPRQDDDD